LKKTLLNNLQENQTKTYFQSLFPTSLGKTHNGDLATIVGICKIQNIKLILGSSEILTCLKEVVDQELCPLSPEYGVTATDLTDLTIYHLILNVAPLCPEQVTLQFVTDI